MESDDDYESFSFHNADPSPSPKHRRLKRLKKSTVNAVQSTTVKSVTEIPDLPRVDFARLEALESSDIRAFDDSSEPLSEGFDGVGDGEELRSGCDKKHVDEDRKVTKKSLKFEEDFDDVDDDDGKVKELRTCYDDTRVNSDLEATKEDLGFEESFGDDVTEENLSSGVGDTVTRTDRKETKRALDFDDDVNERGVDQKVGEEGERTDVEVREAGDVAVNEKKGKKKRTKSSSDDPKAKTSKRREEKERRAHLDQLHVESQRLLRESRGVSFKPVPLVQKPISSILEKIRQRKLEMSKKFHQSNTKDSCKEEDEHVIDHSKSVDTEASDLPEAAKEEKVSDVSNGVPESDDVGMDGSDVCGEQKDVNACPQKDFDVESTPALRAPVDDTQALFGDSQTSDSKESESDESCEQATSSQEEEEEMGPSLLTMKLKFDSAPDDTCDEEENDKENVDPHVQKHSSPKGDPVKAFVDDEAEEEDDSDNDRMVFGDDEEVEDEDDIEELNKMIATDYKEKPIDLETRNELHQKWLEEKDAAGTDDLLRRLNVASRLREASLLDDEEGEEDVEMNDDDDDDNDDDEDGVKEVVARPRDTRFNSKKAKELIAQMYNDKDDAFFSSDDEETERILVRERLRNKTKGKDRLVSPIEDEDSSEVFGLIKKVNTVPEGRKKANTTSFFDAMLTGGNSNSSSKSSFLSRSSSHSVPIPSKPGGSSGVRSFIFGRDDSNSRNSISISENTSDTITSREMETKKVTTKYKGSQLQGRSSTQTAKLVSESSSSSFFEILKRSSVESNGHEHKVELSQSVFAAFKIPKKPMKIQGRV